MTIRPTQRLLWILSGLWLAMSFLELFGWLHTGGLLIFLAILLIALIWDIRLLLKPLTFKLERETINIVPLGVPHRLRFYIEHSSAVPLSISLFDHCPTIHHCDAFPAQLTLLPQHRTRFDYTFTPQMRGISQWSQCDLQLHSKMGWWKRTHRLDATQKIKIYPNYAQSVQFGALAAAQRLNHMGIHASRLRGSGTDFRQLREFRVGDPLNHIDWKASARTRKIIAKEFQQEKQQQLIFLLDLGRHMEQHHGETSHFEQVLTAIILQATVALKQGDSVGLMTFAGEERWLPPQQKTRTLNHLLESLYDLQTTSRPADYLELATRVQRVVKKRSLIVLITPLRSEDQQELEMAMKIIKRKHHVLLITLKEAVVDELSHDRSNSQWQRAAQQYLKEQEDLKISLQSRGLQILDCLPQQLSPSLVNAYLNIKARHLL